MGKLVASTQKVSAANTAKGQAMTAKGVRPAVASKGKTAPVSPVAKAAPAVNYGGGKKLGNHF